MLQTCPSGDTVHLWAKSTGDFQIEIYGDDDNGDGKDLMLLKISFYQNEKKVTILDHIF